MPALDTCMHTKEFLVHGMVTVNWGAANLPKRMMICIKINGPTLFGYSDLLSFSTFHKISFSLSKPCCITEEIKTTG